jgi:general stress protein YciG
MEEHAVPNRKHNQEQGGQTRDHGKGRGFAGMNPDQQREIASEGGRAAHASGHAHEFTSEEARAAGRKGGEARSRSGSASTRSSELRAADMDRDIQSSEQPSSDQRRGGRTS